MGPILSLLFLYFAVRMFFRITKTVLPLALTRLRGKPDEKKFLELTFPSNTSKSAYATEQLYTLLHTLARRKDGFLEIMFGNKKEYSLEIVSTKNEGIRYILAANPKSIDIIKRSLLSFLPGLKIKEIGDYLTNIPALNVEQEDTKDEKTHVGIVELALSSDFVLPLQNQKILKEHDFISYLTGAMTNLDKNELISFQIVTTPVLSGTHNKTISHMQRLRHNIKKGLPIEPLLATGHSLPLPSFVLFVLSPLVWLFVLAFKFIVSMPALLLDTSGKSALILQSQPKPDPQAILNPYEQELETVVREKIGQHLFESSVRVLIVTKSKEKLEERAEGLYSSFGPFTSPYQGLTVRRTFPRSYVSKKRLLSFRQRSVSSGLFSGQNPILSTSELSDIFHFPYTDTTKTEGLVKSKSSDLPAPLSQKKSTTNLDVVVGMNTYGGEETPAGLTSQQRKQHMYIIGKTGMGKSTIIEGMALADIEDGKGLCVIDAHGDMIEHILTLIPNHRKKDVVYINPSDKAYPTGLNIMHPCVDYQDPEEEQGAIARSVIEIFMKITPERHWGQRMEHILRNAALTALQIPIGTAETPYISLYAVQKLLTDSDYRKSVTENIKDPVLKQFWKKEFTLFKKQQGELIGPLTNKIGEFITDKLSRHILLQETSTLNISEIMDEGKILLVNLCKGKLSEERSTFFGTVITSLIQLAINERAQTSEVDRRDFFVYIDEFQNFATPQFTQLFSEARKYHVYFIASHQNIAQIDDPRIAKIIQGNVGTMVALKGSPDDEKTILPLFEPEVEKGQIVNLTPYHFFMKVTNEQSEDAFTGVTIPIN